jgi:hypothetical protein
MSFFFPYYYFIQADQVVTPSSVAINISATAPTINATVKPDSIAVSTTVVAPTATIGALTLTPSAIAVNISATAPSLTVGAVTLTPDNISLSTSVPSHTLNAVNKVLPSFKIEFGSGTVTGDWTTINLENTYRIPIVVCTHEFENQTNPVVMRVRNVNPTSFDVKIEKHDHDAVDGNETFYYFVIERGHWIEDGIEIEANLVELPTCDNGVISDETHNRKFWYSHKGTAMPYWTEPRLFAHIQTANNTHWSSVYLHGNNTSTVPITGSTRSSWVGRHTGVDTDDASTYPETAGYVVFNIDSKGADQFTWLGQLMEMVRTGKVVDGETGSGAELTFTSSFTSAPEVVLCNLTGMAGSNGGWVVLFDVDSSGTAVDSDAFGAVTIEASDTDKTHATEYAHYAVSEYAFSYSNDLTITIAPQSPQINWAVNPNTITVDTSVAAPQINHTVNPDAVAVTISANTITIDNTLALSPSTTDVTLAINTPTISRVLLPSTTIAAITIQAPTIVAGETTLTPTAVSLPISTTTTALVAGSPPARTPSAVDFTLSAASPTVVIGGITVQPDSPVTQIAIAGDITVSHINRITLSNPLSITISPQAPTLVAGEVTLTPSAINVSTTAQSPTLVPGEATLTPNAITCTISSTAPTIHRTMVPSAVTCTTSVASPTLVAGETTLAPTTVDLSVALHPRALAYINFTVKPSTATVNIGIQSQLLAYPQTITPDLITVGNITILSPTVIIGPVYANPTSPISITTSALAPQINWTTRVSAIPLNVNAFELFRVSFITKLLPSLSSVNIAPTSPRIRLEPKLYERVKACEPDATLIGKSKSHQTTDIILNGCEPNVNLTGLSIYEERMRGNVNV